LATIQDVADRAQVSRSTVSYVLNGTRPISEKTRQRILAAMEELSFQPNLFARGLASKRSHLLAFLFPIREAGYDPTTSAFIMGAARAASEHGYHLIYLLENAVDPAALRQLAGQGLVDGVILLEIHLQDERVEQLYDLKFPFSMIGRRADDLDAYVDTDFEQTLRDSVNHLAQLGHTKIAFLNQPQARFEAGYGPVVRAQAAFEKSIHAAGLQGVTQFCDWASAGGYDALNAVLQTQPDTTALITMNEAAIPGVMRAAYARGWKIPDDFSLMVVMASINLAEMIIPKLTVMEIPTVELARVATEILINQLDGEVKEPPRVLLPCRLVMGESTGPRRQR
jgi:DNA-binding LacI/PurR family transcriptional regulator